MTINPASKPADCVAHCPGDAWITQQHVKGGPRPDDDRTQTRGHRLSAGTPARRGSAFRRAGMQPADIIAARLACTSVTKGVSGDSLCVKGRDRKRRDRAIPRISLEHSRGRSQGKKTATATEKADMRKARAEEKAEKQKPPAEHKVEPRGRSETRRTHTPRPRRQRPRLKRKPPRRKPKPRRRHRKRKPKPREMGSR